MSHLPFEIWLLSEEPLSDDENRALQEHLRTCEQCRQLQESWSGVHMLFDDVPQMEPQHGFVNRWQTRLEADRQADQMMRYRWQSWIMLIGIANFAAFTLLLVGLLLSNTYDSIVEYFLTWIYRGAATLTLVNGIQGVVTTLLRTIPDALPLTVWVGIGTVLSVAVIIWIISIAKLTSMPRRASK